MKYEYRGTQTVEAERERQEKLKTELALEREKLQETLRIRRENERLEAQILRTKQRAQAAATPLPKQPEPIHGGPRGLKRAANEIAEYNARQRHVNEAYGRKRAA